MKRFKTLAAVLTLICFLFSSSVVFAAQGNTVQDKVQDKVQERAEQRSQVRTWFQELKPLFEQVRKNNVEIIRLRNELAQTRSQAGEKIKELREQKDTLTEEQVAELKQYLQVIKGDKQEIKDELGNIHKEVLKLRLAKKDGQIDQAKEILQGIIDQQQQRIELLKKTIEDLKDISEV